MEWIFGWQDVMALSLGGLGFALACWLWRTQAKGGCAKCPMKDGLGD